MSSRQLVTTLTLEASGKPIQVINHQAPETSKKNGSGKQKTAKLPKTKDNSEKNNSEKLQTNQPVAEKDASTMEDDDRMIEIIELQKQNDLRTIRIGELLFWQRETYKKQDAKTFASKFDKFCLLCSMDKTKVDKAIKRYEYVQAIPRENHKQAVSLLYGTTIDKLMALGTDKANEFKILLAKKFKALSAGNNDEKKIKQELKEKALSLFKKQFPVVVPTSKPTKKITPKKNNSPIVPVNVTDSNDIGSAINIPTYANIEKLPVNEQYSPLFTTIQRTLYLIEPYVTGEKIIPVSEYCPIESLQELFDTLGKLETVVIDMKENVGLELNKNIEQEIKENQKEHLKKIRQQKKRGEKAA